MSHPKFSTKKTAHYTGKLDRNNNNFGNSSVIGESGVTHHEIPNTLEGSRAQIADLKRIMDNTCNPSMMKVYECRMSVLTNRQTR